MRDFLFRGKSVNSGKWIYGGYFKTDNEHYIITNTDNLVGFNLWDYAELIIPETISEFIGLTDKNGKKIFEGDIIAYKNYNGKLVVEGVVKYGNFNCSCCDGVFGWYVGENGDIRNLQEPNDFYEVIGNIHDNPELLEENENERN